MLDDRTRPIPKPGYAHVTQRNSASRIEVDKLSLHCDTKRGGWHGYLRPRNRPSAFAPALWLGRLKTEPLPPVDPG